MPTETNFIFDISYNLAHIYIYIILLVNVSHILNLSEFFFLNSQPLVLLENKCLKYKLLYFVDSREF